MLNQWIYRPCISCQEYRIFYTAAGENKESFQPLSVANQDDLRYRYVCESVVLPTAPTHFAVIEIYLPRSGKPYVTKILPINVDL